MPVPVRRVGRIARQDSEHSDSTHLLRDRHLLDSPSHITWIDPSSHRGVRLSNRTANRSVGDFKPWFKWTSSHTRPRKRDHFFFRSYMACTSLRVPQDIGNSTSDADRNPAFVQVWIKWFDALPVDGRRYENEEEVD